MGYMLQHHADQCPDVLCRFWSKALGVKKTEIKVIRKSNSGKLGGRNWASVHGLFTVRTSDTYLRSRLQAWMDLVTRDWVKVLGA